MSGSSQATAPADTSPGDDAAPGTGGNVCPICKGSGRTADAPCMNCGGTGVVTQGLAAG